MIPWPSSWLTIWVLLNIALTLLNKSAFHHVPFGYPLTLSAIHMSVNSLFTHLMLNVFHSAPKEEVTAPLYKRIVMLSTLFSLNVVFGNAGLKYASVSLREVVRCIIPGITMGFSVWLLRKRYTLQTVLSLAPIMIGVVLSSLGDLEFSWIGLVVLLLSCVLAAAKGVFTYKFLVGLTPLPPIQLLSLLAPLAMVQMIVLAVLTGELSDIWDRREELTRPLVIGVVLTTGLLAFLLNWSNFQSSKDSSPLTISVAGCFKEVVTIALSFFIFNSVLTMTNLAGIVLAISGAFFYHYMSHTSLHSAPTVKPTPHPEKSTAIMTDEETGQGHTT